MGKLPKIFYIVFVCVIFSSSLVFSFELENTADNPRLVNIAPEQMHELSVIENRIYGNSFKGQNTLERIERLEMDLFHGFQNGTLNQRLNTLKIESTRAALRGNAMTPMMMSAFNTKYINSSTNYSTYHEDVGLIDGLIKVWYPDFYNMLENYRKFKEDNCY